jgi:hypothetical protein
MACTPHSLRWRHPNQRVSNNIPAKMGGANSLQVLTLIGSSVEEATGPVVSVLVGCLVPDGAVLSSVDAGECPLLL